MKIRKNKSQTYVPNLFDPIKNKKMIAYKKRMKKKHKPFLKKRHRHTNSLVYLYLAKHHNNTFSCMECNCFSNKTNNVD